MKVSVAVLTKNGGRLLKECLDAVCAQRFDSFEILVIDSGSTDGSAELVRANPRVRFVAIPPAEFQHGRTRNLAMRGTKGDLVAFLTQDAVPDNGEWLAELVAFMDSHPDVAGAFGHQIPRADADLLEAWEVSSHFGSFLNQPEVFRLAPGAGFLEPQLRVRLHFFSNVNSCIRRAAWERVAFPEVDFGEDQAWARAVQDAGLATGFAQRAVVRHSHNYGSVALFRRRYDEARFMQRQFGFALIGSWRHAWRVATETHAAFRAQLANVPPPQRRGAARRAWASTLGRFAGTRLAGMDGFVHRWLSLSERHRRT